MPIINSLDPAASPGPGYVWNTNLKRWVDVDQEITQPELRNVAIMQAIAQYVGRAYPKVGIGLKVLSLCLELIPDSWQAGMLSNSSVVGNYVGPFNGTAPQAVNEVTYAQQNASDVLQMIMDGLYGPVTSNDGTLTGVVSYARMSAQLLHRSHRTLYDVLNQNQAGARGAFVQGSWRLPTDFKTYGITANGGVRDVKGEGVALFHRAEVGYLLQSLLLQHATTNYWKPDGSQTSVPVFKHVGPFITAASRWGDLKP